MHKNLCQAFPFLEIYPVDKFKYMWISIYSRLIDCTQMQLAYPPIGNDLINSDTHIQLNSMQLLETTTLKRSLHITL